MNTALLYQLKSLIFIAIGLFGFGLLVGVHEFGHYIFARLFGVRAPSFSIGFGPTIISKKIAGTEFKISAIPLGGYVEIAGMAEVGQGEQKEAHANDQGSFVAKAYWQKTIILLGGILFNLIMAFLILIGLYLTGIPKTTLLTPDEIKPVLSVVIPEKVAEKAGLLRGDEIIKVNGITTPHALATMKELKKHEHQPISLTIKRDDKEIAIPIIFEKTNQIGIEFKTTYSAPLSFFESIKTAAFTTWAVTKKTAEVFVYLFKKRTVEGVGGTLEIMVQMISNAKQGISVFLFLLAFISINLAVLNLVPLPITDGGQLVLTTIEAIIRRPLPEKLLEIIHTITWILVLSLLAYLTFKDFQRLFWDKITAFFGK